MFAGMLASAQTINVVDSSNPASKISIDGVVTFDKTVSTCSLAGTNTSNKTVQTVALVIKITRPDGVYAESVWVHTHRRGIAPNERFAVADGDCSANTETANNIRQTKDPASANAEVLAVRYMDGSTWGNQKVLE